MASFLSDIEIDQKALTHRRQLGFRDDQVIDGMTLITKLKHRYPTLNYLRIKDEEWIGVDEALWDSDKKRISIRESVFCALNKGNPRAMMTLVHEVGHILLGHKGILSRAPTGNLAEKYSRDVKRMEYQAKRYAAAFLMPNTPENKKIDASDLVKKYGVSLQSALIRVTSLGRDTGF